MLHSFPEKDPWFHVKIDSTAIGPALGGLRMLSYDSPLKAIEDCEVLAAGMTLKNALAGIPYGGGKAVIDRSKTPLAASPELLMRQVGVWIDTLGGGYITAEDMGTTSAHMEIIESVTPHVAYLKGSSPAPATAFGVICAMEAVNDNPWRQTSVHIQGLGSVGMQLAKHLIVLGVKKLTFEEINEDTVELFKTWYSEFKETKKNAWGNRPNPFIEHLTALPTTEFDIFAPCARGQLFDMFSAKYLRCRIICGSANNQLIDDEVSVILKAYDIIYAPDFLVNAGGVINIARERGLLDTDFLLVHELKKIGIRLNKALANGNFKHHNTPLKWALNEARSRIASAGKPKEFEIPPGVSWPRETPAGPVIDKSGFVEMPVGGSTG